MPKHPPKSDPPGFELRDLAELGFDSDTPDEEITIVTAKAIIADQKDDRDNDTKSFLALMRYIGVKHRGHDRRITRLERLAFAVSVVIVVAMGVLEILHNLRH